MGKKTKPTEAAAAPAAAAAPGKAPKPEKDYDCTMAVPEAEPEVVPEPDPDPIPLPVPLDWLPLFVIINYKVARQNDDDDGLIICDENWRIEFHAKMRPTKHALLLYDIRIKRHVLGNPVYSAYVAGEASRNLFLPDKVQPAGELNAVVDAHEERQRQNREEFDRHILLFIHGFNSIPSNVFASCRQYKQRQRNRIVVPVLWADEHASIFGYLPDKLCNVPKAVRSFVSLLDEPNAFPQRSLICHSMGNYLLQSMAMAYWKQWEGGWRPRFEHCFQYIFMVAADVTVRLFDGDRNRNTIRSKNVGNCVVNLVQRHVHILHSDRDVALKARVVPNCCGQALGLHGYKTGSLHGEAAGKLRRRDCIYVSEHCGDPLRHSYFFHNDLIQYYEQTMNTRINDQN